MSLAFPLRVCYEPQPQPELAAPATVCLSVSGPPSCVFCSVLCHLFLSQRSHFSTILSFASKTFFYTILQHILFICSSPPPPLPSLYSFSFLRWLFSVHYSLFLLPPSLYIVSIFFASFFLFRINDKESSRLGTCVQGKAVHTPADARPFSPRWFVVTIVLPVGILSKSNGKTTHTRVKEQDKINCRG